MNRIPTTPEEVTKIRARDGVGLQEAKRRITVNNLEIDIEEATSFKELKNCVLRLIRLQNN